MVNIDYKIEDIKINDTEKKLMEKKVHKLEKFNVDLDINAHMYEDGSNVKVELITNYYKSVIKITNIGKNTIEAMDIAIDKLERQVRKQKDKMKEKHNIALKDSFGSLDTV